MENKLNWDFTSIFKDEKEFEETYNEVEKDISKLDDYFNRLSPTMNVEYFHEIIFFGESIQEKLSKLMKYVALLSSLDSKSQKVMKLNTKLEKLSIKYFDEAKRFNQWFYGLKLEGKDILDDKNAQRLFKSTPKHYFVLMYGRKIAKHQLPLEIEKILFKKDLNGVDVISELYNKITTNFSFIFKLKGEKEKKFDNIEELRKYIRSPVREVREETYRSIFESHKNDKEILFEIYSAIVKDWGLDKTLRNYKSPINIRNINNMLSDEVIEILLNVCKKNINIYQEFFKLKAKYLCVDKFSRVDIYAPIKEKEKNYSFDKSKEIVLDMFKEFSLNFFEKAKSIFDKGHIDSHPNKNKRSGAFCMYITPKIEPYVLLNHVGTRRDVFTMAHELGHAIHGLYARELPHSLVHAPIPLCETASTFSEILLFERMLQMSNEEEKKELILDQLSGSYASVIRQAFFTIFEVDAHEKIREGTNEQELSDLYYNNLKEQFGGSMEIPEDFKYEWSCIPHIFNSPFYCYSYSFGDLLSLALYSSYKKQGKKFIPKIERILSSGGSEDPEELLKKEGFDISKEEFWQSGFDVVKGWLEELKKF